MTRQALTDQLADIECQLSPENLCGDGEFSRASVNRRADELVSRRNTIIAELSVFPPQANLNISI
jgi:hypothetical protein